MEFDKLFDLIGHSVHDLRFKKVLRELNIEEIPKAKFKGYISITTIPDFEIPRFYIEDLGVRFSFRVRRGLDKEDLKSSYTEDEYELVVKEVSFSKMVEGTVYPFGCRLDDHDKTVTKKIDEKPSEKRKANPDGFVYCYYKDNLEILVYFNNGKQLQHFSAALQDSITKKHRRFKASLKIQKNKINSRHLNELRALAGAMPTEAWMSRMLEEDDESRAAQSIRHSIDAVRTILTQFLSALESAVNNNKASQILMATKKTVLALNKLNAKSDSLIHTLEREELVEFITEAVRLTGFEVETGGDITEEWREW